MKTINAEKLIKYCEGEKKKIYDPDDEGVTQEEAYAHPFFSLDEGDQTAISTYDEIIDWVNKQGE